MVCRLSSTRLGGVTNYAFSMGGLPYFGARVWLVDSFDVEFYCLASRLSADQGWALGWGAFF